MMTNAEAESWLHWLRDLRDQRFRMRHKLVLFMALSYRSQGLAPTAALLEKSTRLGSRTVRRTVADLVTWGYLLACAQPDGSLETLQLVRRSA
ncbi:MAG: hypothetical protein JWP97_5394 [Labilithrix sp.]|nr:hypothetical protein [Labilithrix sp.]